MSHSPANWCDLRHHFLSLHSDLSSTAVSLWDLAGLFSFLRPRFSRLQNEEIAFDLPQGSSWPPPSPLRPLAVPYPTAGLLGPWGRDPRHRGGRARTGAL